ncbi:MAG TPA: SDR family oxidoreductase [Polyangiaceae bacterium]|nr:SDR family oxidoreductase [Polyangiaceae bacterium]
MSRFSQRGVLITGASRGLGRALFEQLARSGARVVGVARRTDDLERAAQALRAEGFEAHALAADAGDIDAIYPLAGASQALVGPIELLVHAASTLGPTPLGPLLDLPCEEFSRVLQLNLLGPFRLTRAIVGGMLVRGSGIVVSISSDAAVNAYPHWGAYGASKAALDHLSRTWAAELRGTGVSAISIDPGEMDTDMHRDALPDSDPATLARPVDVARQIIAGLERLTPGESGSRVIAADWSAP